MILIIVVVQIFSSYANGINIGLMVLDENYLEIMIKGPHETPDDLRNAKLAKAVLPLRARGTQMLITILLGVAITNTSLSVLMASVEGDIAGFLISTAVIAVFGEIVP
jgi:metal transporter CNNM